jgi:hypothetical protein
MILDFKLTANRDTITISAPQVELVAEVRNSVACLGPNKQIVAIGDTPDEIKRNAPEFWARNGPQITFLRPFDLEGASGSGAGFDPLLAARIVQWFSNKAFARMKRNSLKRLILSPWVDRVDYRLELNGYERLPADVRRQFVGRLKKLLVAVRRIQINGELVTGRNRSSG